MEVVPILDLLFLVLLKGILYFWPFLRALWGFVLLFLGFLSKSKNPRPSFATDLEVVELIEALLQRQMGAEGKMVWSAAI